MIRFRYLTAADVECRVQQCTEKGCSLLLYKNARCDMNVLDETVGPQNWQRHHSRDNANCTISIWDEEKRQWIEKEDTGTESNTEAEKGLASDSFKRAGVNWGIGRELYTAPFIWIPAAKCELYETNRTDRAGKKLWACKSRFEVADLHVENGRITGLFITCKGNTVYSYGTPSAPLVCENCSAPITDSKRRDGSPWPAGDIAAYSKSSFGKLLCPACMREAYKK